MLSNALSLLQAIYIYMYDHPMLVKILEQYMELTKDWKEIVLSGSLALWALGVIQLQTLQLKMPLLATPRLSSSHSQTENHVPTTIY